MTPEEFSKTCNSYLDNLRKAQNSYVAVGLPNEKVGGKVYGDGMTVLRVGAIHEYGLGPNPQRSFLRAPFISKKAEMADFIGSQFEQVLRDGKSADQALGLIGVKATNIVKGAFTSRGYGQWPDILQSTKTAKGSSQVLIDTRILAGSITFVVRAA